MKKINWKQLLSIVVWLLVIGLLIYTRSVNLNWGLPYPMHPDERNMANAVQSLHCKISNLKECFNPHFFAYGQLPLYFGFIIAYIIKFFNSSLIWPMSYSEATLSLRIISSLISIITALLMIKLIVNLANINSFLLKIFISLVIIFTPGLIQFSHFGTTESLLIFFYLLIINCSVLFFQKKVTLINFLVFTSFVSGLSIATKVSSAIFLIIPLVALLMNISQQKVSKIAYGLIIYGLIAILVSVIFSPHNFINLNEFLGSMKYETSVATGNIIVFYTRQFVETTPVIFQINKIFPYVFGWPIFIMAILEMVKIFLRIDDKKELRFLLLALIIYFFPNAFLFAKWTRFMAPIFPIILIFSAIFIAKLNMNRFLKGLIIFIGIIPGIAYLSIYNNIDVRFKASEWIYKNISNNSYILSETANVVDIPILINNSQIPNYNVISFNFYELDNDGLLPMELNYHLQKADYVFIPSRRIFANYTCENPNGQSSSLHKNKSVTSYQLFNKNCINLEKKYPRLNEYYQKLFKGELGFKQIIKFNSYPSIKLFGKEILRFADEEAEETWTVFDHPVIRIYKK